MTVLWDVELGVAVFGEIRSPGLEAHGELMHKIGTHAWDRV